MNQTAGTSKTAKWNKRLTVIRPTKGPWLLKEATLRPCSVFHSFKTKSSRRELSDFQLPRTPHSPVGHVAQVSSTGTIFCQTKIISECTRGQGLKFLSKHPNALCSLCATVYVDCIIVHVISNIYRIRQLDPRTLYVERKLQNGRILLVTQRKWTKLREQLRVDNVYVDGAKQTSRQCCL